MHEKQRHRVFKKQTIDVFLNTLCLCNFIYHY